MEKEKAARVKKQLRVATYNIHKCRGMDGRVSVERVARVLQELHCDVIALQEVWRASSGDQAAMLAEALGFAQCFGKARELRGADYGNATLSRLPVVGQKNHDITASPRESRACLRVDVQLPGDKVARIFNAHLGTGFMERRKQARLMVHEALLGNKKLLGSRILLGDFNEWTRGLTTELLSAHMSAVDLRKGKRRARSYPGMLPLLHLDHIYFDDAFELVEVSIHRSRLAKIASDHLPLVATFRY